MKVDIKSLQPNSVWSVIFNDEGSWRSGLYKPECNNQNEITILERHSCPELFVCLKGKMGLVIYGNNKETIFTMEPEQAILITDFHNGFSIDSDGYFLVVERTTFNTEYIDRKSRAFIKKIEVR